MTALLNLKSALPGWHAAVSAIRAMRAIHTWPSSQHPTPYEIFGMTPSTFDRKKLKSIYIELAKAYHPDRCKQSRDSQLRFKQLSEAYSILRTDQKRKAWDARNYAAAATTHNYTRTWSGASSHSSTNFRDPYDPDLDTAAQEAKFRDGLNDSRLFILKVVICIVVLIGIMEVTALFRATDRRIERMENLSRQAGMAHSLAFNNYHKGSTAQERIDRFLLQREHTLQHSRGDFRYSTMSQTSDEK